MFWRTIWRIIVIGFAFVVATIVALTVFASIGLEQFTQVWRGRGAVWDNIDGMAVAVNGGWRLVSAATLVPALLIILVGEIGSIRSSLYYVLGGGAALAAIPLIARWGETGVVAGPALVVWEIFATAGFAGGGVYWLIAGRRA